MGGWYSKSNQYLKDEIKYTVLPRIRRALSDPVDAECPTKCLCHNVDNRRVAELVNQFSDDTRCTDAVYVLECLPRNVTQKLVREEFHLQQDARWVDQAQSKEQLLYVGVSQNVVNRMQEHVRAKGSGAHFTQIFPASRLLSIEWYPTNALACRAEEITAQVLREETSDQIYVSQPG